MAINFTTEAAKAALTDILNALEDPENVLKLSNAKESSGNEMLKTMQFVFPTVMQIQMEVIKKYGFPDGREGAVQFAQLIRKLEKEDTDVAKLHTQAVVVLERLVVAIHEYMYPVPSSETHFEEFADRIYQYVKDQG